MFHFEEADGFRVHDVHVSDKGSYVRVESTSTMTSKTTDDHGGPNKGKTSATKTSTDKRRSSWRRYGKDALRCLGMAGAIVLAGTVALMGAALLVTLPPVVTVAVAVVAVVAVTVAVVANVAVAPVLA